MVACRWLLSTALSLLCIAPVRADELRERQLELDITQLRRELQAQARRIDELERLVRLDAPSRTSSRGVAATEPIPGWLLAANWNRIKPSMSELEVIAILGKPSSVRTGANGSTRTLLYALEIGTGAFLAGSVEVGPKGVIAVNKPALR
jgi:hypothetical protein